MNIEELKKESIEYLKKNNVFEYDIIDIYKIIMYYYNIDNLSKVIYNNDIEIGADELIDILQIVHKFYVMREPLQYILGKEYFFRELYSVNEDVLIPRSDTEVLVEKAIEYIDKYGLNTMLDLCTGSGCIGISTAKNSTVKKVVLSDISLKALNVANRNIRNNKISRKCKTELCNLFIGLKEIKKFDIIVSNPPYIRRKDLANLDNVVSKEPKIALDGGRDGLTYYRKIIKNSLKHLTDGGYLMLEIGYDQLEDVKKIIAKYKKYNLVECVKDYSGNDRVIICRFQQKLNKKY